MHWRKQRRQLGGAATSARGGFLLLEAAVALALLAAAATAVASLASSLARERRAQLQQLTVQLEAENIVQRLQAAEYAELPRVAERLSSAAQSTTAATSSDSLLVARVALEPFAEQGIEGQHITVTVALQRQLAARPRQVKLEFWRFGPPETDGP